MVKYCEKISVSLTQNSVLQKKDWPAPIIEHTLENLLQTKQQGKCNF